MAAKKLTEKQRLAERLRRVGFVGAEKLTLSRLRLEVKRFKSKGVKVPDLREENPGQSESLAKKPSVIELKEAHLMEEVEVTITNKSTRERTVEKKTRLMAILEMLSSKAIREKDTQAAKEYLDRTLGKSSQEVKMTGDIKVEEQRLPTKAEMAAARAYAEALRYEDDDE